MEEETKQTDQEQERIPLNPQANWIPREVIILELPNGFKIHQESSQLSQDELINRAVSVHNYFIKTKEGGNNLDYLK